MRIIISPAKKMKSEEEYLKWSNLPCYLSETGKLLSYLKSLKYEELKNIWKCNDKIVQLNYERLQYMDLKNNLVPAILSYDGIQYQYIGSQVMEDSQLEYIEEHLRILSGFYGILKPFDGVVPYRLEMQSKLCDFEVNTLYEYWDNKIFSILKEETDSILNLASKEYSKCIEKYLCDDIKFVTCIFGELIDGKVKEKGTFAKMARGEMVRYLSEIKANKIEEAKSFSRLGYSYSDELSSDTKYVFVKGE